MSFLLKLCVFLIFIGALFDESVAQISNLQCGQTSRFKRTILRSPVKDSAIPSCQYTIRRQSNHVCQLRIQFQKFELQQPTVDTETNTLTCSDSFTAGRFTLCGENTGQHLYIPFEATVNMLNFNLPSRSSQSNWHLIVEQLECPPAPSHLADGLLPLLSGVLNDIFDLRNIFSRFINDFDLLAPVGCDQYYTQSTGLIQSFNYQDGRDAYYMPNLKYTICIKQTAAAQSIEYTIKKFSLSSELLTEFYNDACHPIIYTEGRQSDYLMIPNSHFADNAAFQPTYYCGQALTAGQVLIGSTPFIMHFSSDSEWDSRETGFGIEYRTKSSV